MKIQNALASGKIAAVSLALACLTGACSAQETKTPAAADPSPAKSDGDTAWSEVRKALQPPAPPAEWRTQRPSPKEIDEFRAKQKAGLEGAIDKIRAFHQKFPNHARASEARQQELELLRVSVQLGNDKRVTQLEALEIERLKDPKLSEDDRFEIRSGMVARVAAQAGKEKFSETEKAVRELQKEFPTKEEVFEILIELSSNAEPDKAKALLQEVAASPVASDEAKDRAKGVLKKVELLGQPVPIKFTALKGEEIDLAKMKGKVVLIDFWATWCGPCMLELPNVKSTYEKLHSKGFEIVGISFDQSKEDLEKVLTDEKMAWPQYFDGTGWKNKFGQQFGISSIPAMWLVDKKGNLRDLNARENLAGKVERMLAE